MDKHFKCKCGNNEFWYYVDPCHAFLSLPSKVKCKKCYMEYGIVTNLGKNYSYHYTRTFDKRTKKHGRWLLDKKMKLGEEKQI